jgi:iron complex outermembrane receptor protein
MSNRYRIRLIQATLLLPVLLPGASVATELEEIVVTAERRTQSIQDVPLSVAAIGGDDVRLGKVTGLNDVAFKTPGLTFNQFNIGEPRVYIRGIGNSSDSAASDQAVGVFLDEVYIGRTGGVGFDLYDLERVEILRGPQGTLYGKNTNGGAINIVTSRPSQEKQLKIGISVGNHGTAQLQVFNNGGITDTIAGKLVVSAKQHDGYGRNVITDSEILSLGQLSNSTIIGPSIGAARSGDRLDDGRNLSVRGQLLFDLSQSAQLLVGADYAKDKSNGSCRHLKNLDQAIQGLGTFWALGMSAAYMQDDRNCASQFNTDQDRDLGGLLARLDLDMNWATLTSITAWRESDYTFVDDLTGLPLNDLAAVSPPGLPPPLSLPGVFTVPENVIDGVHEKATQLSQELRLTGSSGSLDWVAGAFFMREKVKRDEEFYTQYSTLLQFLGLAAIGDVLFTQDNTTTSTALYGQADWHFTDQWTLTYGVRWSDDEKKITQDAIDLRNAGPPTGVPLILPAFPAPVSASKSWSKVTNKASLSFRPSDGLMFYATYSEGFKSGAFPSQTNRPSAATESVAPETVSNVEAGFKSTWLDKRVQFNASYYDMDYKDLQVFELNQQFLLVLSSAQAKSKGFDVELNVLVGDNLQLSSSYNHSDAKYTDFVLPNGTNVSGNDMVFAPKSAYTIDADYRVPLDTAGSLDFNVAYNWKSSYFTAVTNAPKTRQGALGMLGAGVSWTSSDASWMVSMWGKNLTDEQEISSRIVDPTGITSEFYMPPRTYGLTVTKTF